MTTHNAMHQMKTLCSSCSLRELCLPVGLLPNEFAQLDAVIRQSRRLKKGEYLFRTGEPFASLFAIRAGFFKTTVASQDGRDQVTGFFMSGELIGMDGICSHVHSCDAVALEDSEVCELPFTHIEELGHNNITQPLRGILPPSTDRGEESSHQPLGRFEHQHEPHGRARPFLTG